MCALIYQTAWLRQFRMIFGASTFATAAVLAIFMGGLGLGSALLGKRADRKTRPLLYYGNLELLIAIAAASSPLLLWLAAMVYFGLGGSGTMGIVLATVVRLILSTLVLGLPTLLMGGTLPAAARAVSTHDDSGRHGVALLYGINTCGAVAGALFSTFYMLEHFGTRRTLYIAVLINVLVAIAARAMSRTMSDVAPDEPVSAVDETLIAETSEVPRRAVYAASAAVGFAFLLMELVWYRMLSPLLGGTTFMFGLILALALAGIALGGLAYTFWSGRRAATAGMFALTCSLEAAAIALPFALGDQLAVVTSLIRSLGVLGFPGHVLGWTVISGFVIVPAAFISGVQFPLLIALLGRGRENVGRQVGTAYAWNTLGAITGSLAGGFGLMPFLSAPGCWRLVVLLLAGVGLFALIYALREQQRGLAAAAGVAALLALAATLATGPTAVWRHSGIGVGRGPRNDINAIRNWENRTRRNLLWDEDGRESSVAVTLPDDLAFVVNGKSDGSARADAPTQVMSGIVGAMIHPNPKTAMVIGLGTGSTAGWLGVVKSMERVDSVELEPVVLDVAELCAPVNQNVMKNPRVHVEVGDAREALLASRRTYDLIFSEPSNPYRAGIASLFTREFYEASSARLNRGGIFLQWIQAYGIDAETMRTVYATLHTVFPHIDSWWTSSGDLILAASREPHVYDVDLIRRRLTEEPFRSAVHNTWRVETAEGFFSRFVASELLGHAIARETQTYNTDDRTVIEFGFARALSDNLFRLDEVFVAAQRLGAIYPARMKGTLNRELVEANRATIGTIGAEGMRQRFAAAVDLGNLDQALSLWSSKPWSPVNTREVASIGIVLAAAGSANAEAYAAALRAWSPVESDVMLGRLRYVQKRYPESAELTRRAFVEYRRNPWPRPDIMARGIETAKMLALVNPALAREMYQLFSEPFILGQMHDERRKALVAMGLSADQCGPLTMRALQALEPNPDWSAFGLQVRAACYARAQAPLADVAARDYESFLAAIPAPLVKRP